MHLVSAVIVATSHTITLENAEVYLKYMLDYLNGIRTLFPEYTFRPNHHMALHIYDFLLSFGPVHSWWAVGTFVNMLINPSEHSLSSSASIEDGDEFTSN